MRKTFITTITDLAEGDNRIMLLTGDLGFMLMEPFIQKFPNRFINVGVAEQNLVGISTGLAEAGMIPFVYSITPFAVLRPYEFIRNGPIYHKLQVRIIGAGGGFEYAHDGISHFGIDDIGVLRIQPGISIFAPADFQQARTILNKTWEMPGPIYYRLGKDEKTSVQDLNGAFEIGQAQIIGNGADILFISLGSIANEVVEAVNQLGNRGIRCTIMIVASINPPPLKTFGQILSQFHHIVTVEAHYVNGGLGSLVSEYIAENNLDCQLMRCGVKTMPDALTGSQQYLYQKFGIASGSLIDTAVTLMNVQP